MVVKNITEITYMGLLLNKLKDQKSEYLRESADQPINWFIWSEEAFEQAKKEDKLILIDVGASWCHWCHVMDENTYSNKEVSEIINENFIAIKIDRDELPDVDRKLQEAVSLITGNSGWPLTVFMTPDKKVFYGGTYFPAEDNEYQVGFKRILKEILRLWKEDRNRLINSSLDIISSSINIYSTPLSNEFVQKISDYVYSSYDFNFGGIDSEIKFPHPTTDQFLLSQHFKNKKYMDPVLITLKNMYYGGIFDHVFGGFHRYSTDRYWKVPHFEKLLIDNSELILSYFNAYLITYDRELLDAINMTVDFILNEMKNDIGFSNSIDADYEGIEGKYYTWTEKEFKEALGDLFDISLFIFDFYNLLEVEGRKVLSRKSVYEISNSLNISQEDSFKLINNIRNRLRKYKESWRKPRKDNNAYTYQNARAAEALLLSSLLTNKGIDESLNIIEKLGNSGRRINENGEKILEDLSSSLSSSLTAYEVTGDQKYLELSLNMWQETKDFKAEIGFKERRNVKESDTIFSDTPNESPNSIIIKSWLKLYQSGRIDFDEKMESLASIVMREPVFHSGLALSISSYINGIAHIVVIDENDEKADLLHKSSLLTYYPLKFVERITDERKDELPSYMREMLKYGNGSRVYVCKGKTCSMPIYEGEKIKFLLK